MCSIDWQILLEFFKLIISWPVITGAIIIILVTNFKAPIEKWIGNIASVKAGIGNNTLELIQQQAPLPNPTSESILESATAGDVIVDATTSSPASPPVIPEEIKHIPNIENIIENVRNNPANVVVEFMKLGRALSFEKIFTAIFGSQIMLLNNLLMHPDTWKNVSEIANYQKLHQERTGSLSIELNQYLMFLQTEGLILLETNGNNQLLKITPFGIEFIRYIQQHYALNWINKSL